MGEPKNPHFYDFGIFEPSPSPKTNYVFLSLETPGYLKQSRKYGTMFEQIIVINLETLEIEKSEMLEQIWKRPAPKNDEKSLNKILNILDMRSISTDKPN